MGSVTTGSYTGDDTVGKVITVGFTPVAVWVWRDISSTGTNDYVWFKASEQMDGTHALEIEFHDVGIRGRTGRLYSLSSTGTGQFLVSDANGGHDPNATGVDYSWIAFGE